MFFWKKSITNILVFQFILLLGLILSVFGILVYINAAASTKQGLDDTLYMEMQSILTTLSPPANKTPTFSWVDDQEKKETILQNKCEEMEMNYTQSGSSKEESGKICKMAKIAKEVVEPSTNITELSPSTLDAITQEQMQKASNLGLLVYFLDKKGSIVQSSSATDFSFTPEISGYFNRFLENEEYRFYGVSLKNWYLVVGQNVTQHEQQLNKLALNLILLGIGVLILSAFIAYGFIRRALKPFSHFMSEVDALNPYTLSETKNFADYEPYEVQKLKGKFEQFIVRIVQMLSREKAFMQDVSHELRTPLMVIKTSLELLPQPTSQRDKETFTILDGATSRLGDLIGELGFLNQDTQQLRTQEIDMAEFLSRFCGQYELLARQKWLSFELRIPHSFVIQGNEFLLQKIIGNLLLNAIKYTQEGEIKIHITPEKKIVISDSGNGVSPEKLEHIFDRFYRGDTKTDGFGLGLAIVKKIVDESNWHISFTSSKKQGTTVTIDFA